MKVVSGNAGDEVSNTAIVNGEEVGPTVNPIEKIVNVTKYKNNIASTNIVLVLDTSSSMNRYPSNNKNAPEGQRRIDIDKKAIKAFVNSTYEIDKNADVNLSDNEGNTPLHIACYHGCLALVKKLIEHQANPFKKTNKRNYPLSCAVNEDKKDVVIFLVQSFYF